MGIGWGGMGEGLGRWKVAAYGISLGIDFANLDWQKTANSCDSSRPIPVLQAMENNDHLEPALAIAHTPHSAFFAGAEGGQDGKGTVDSTRLAELVHRPPYHLLGSLWFRGI